MTREPSESSHPQGSAEQNMRDHGLEVAQIQALHGRLTEDFSVDARGFPLFAASQHRLTQTT